MQKVKRKTKRLPITSPKEQVRIMAAAFKVIVPPDNIQLIPEQRVFFDSIINEIANADWTPHQVELVAMLSRTMYEMSSNQEKLHIEGDLVPGRDGRPSINPRKKIIDSCYNKIIAMRRSLGIHNRADGASRRDDARRKDLAKLAQDTILHQVTMGAGGLINRPAH